MNRSLHWKAADVAEQADVAILLAPPAAAEVEYSKAADGEVVADRIGGVEFRQAVGDRAGGLPVGGLAVIQSEKRGDAVHVRVERHDQFGRIDEVPDAEVGRVAADHPAEEKIHP